ncbi:hypothetical protein CCO03_12145 [Comamonas serinivorans]|uniref:Uncharacterized protein n=1 Tax=Comamonas serinivorans TaxID=1082851 RepID=A0A1Y0ENX1_9BURK|nr:hypothetical protein [Comamonas serinivorans]ARU05335.1 hypothetical protein CCO03_12145 [Comamonas serinivorans]
MFDASQRLADAVAQGLGVAWLPTRLFQRDVQAGLLVPVVDLEVDVGRYGLTRLRSRRPMPGPS